MAEAEARPSFFERIQEAGAKLFDTEAAKSAVAAYIDNNEKLAKEFVGLQERMSSWAKDTPHIDKTTRASRAVSATRRIRN